MREVARLAMSTATVYSLIHRGEIPHVRLSIVGQPSLGT